MTTQELTRRILKRLGNFFWLVLIIGAGVGFLLYKYAKDTPVKHIAKASLYALTTKEVSATGGLISTLTGGKNDGMGNLSEEASISLDELANSRTIRENVAATKLPQFNNQSIGSLLIKNEMKHQPLLGPKIVMPKEEIEIISYGASIIQKGLAAKTSKGDLFQISFTSTAKELVSPISYVFINELTAFFIALKVKKAQNDYNFTVRKIDSLRLVMNAYDQRAVQLSNSTMFVPPGKIEYEIPKENLINDKTRVVGIYNGAANNKEEALWRLQRAKPILDLLDKPEAPFDTIKKSPIQFAIIGFILGCFIGLILCVIDIIIKYAKAQISEVVAVSPEQSEGKRNTAATTNSSSVNDVSSENDISSSDILT